LIVTANAAESTNSRTATARVPARKGTSPAKGRARPAQSARETGTRRRSTAPAPARARTGAPPADRADRPTWGFPVAHALRAADRAVQRESVHIELPFVGVVRLPPKDELAFMGGVTGMAAVGILEWPVALLLVLGHTLAANRHNRLMQEFGQALEEA
jgi:hypothetical protein